MDGLVFWVVSGIALTIALPLWPWALSIFQRLANLTAYLVNIFSLVLQGLGMEPWTEWEYALVLGAILGGILGTFITYTLYTLSVVPPSMLTKAGVHTISGLALIGALSSLLLDFAAFPVHDV